VRVGPQIRGRTCSIPVGQETNPPPIRRILIRAIQIVLQIDSPTQRTRKSERLIRSQTPGPRRRLPHSAFRVQRSACLPHFPPTSRFGYVRFNHDSGNGTTQMFNERPSSASMAV